MKSSQLPNRILLVEDDKHLGYILKEYLQIKGFSVELAVDGLIGLSTFKTVPVDICILDIKIPGIDGFELAREIRMLEDNMPIIFLTSKALKIDKIKGFKVGADDYIVKPVDEEELILRIEAILKRAYPMAFGQKVSDSYWIGDTCFLPQELTMIYENRRITLTKKEAELLRMLCENKNKILERSAVLKRIWGKNDYFTRRSMDVFISRLRKYLKVDPKLEIINFHSKGYMLSEES